MPPGAGSRPDRQTDSPLVPAVAFSQGFHFPRDPPRFSFRVRARKRSHRPVETGKRKNGWVVRGEGEEGSSALPSQHGGGLGWQRPSCALCWGCLERAVPRGSCWLCRPALGLGAESGQEKSPYPSAFCLFIHPSDTPGVRTTRPLLLSSGTSHGVGTLLSRRPCSNRLLAFLQLGARSGAATPSPFPSSSPHPRVFFWREPTRFARAAWGSIVPARL